MAINEAIITKARLYAINCHDAVNQQYGNTGYVRHLHMVYLLSKYFIHVLPAKHHNIILSAAWCHDVIRDTRQNYYDVRKATNLLTAEIVFALTPEKGKTRAQRYSQAYFQSVKETLYADYIAICDRMAEVIYSQKNGDSMFRVFKMEHPFFKAMLYKDKYKPLFDHFDEKIFNKDEESTPIHIT